MPRGVTRQLVLRGPIASVRGDAHRLANGFSETLEHRRRERDGAWHITREEAQRRRLPHIGVDELPEVKVRCELVLQRRVPRFHFIEVAGQMARTTLAITENAAGHQRV